MAKSMFRPNRRFPSPCVVLLSFMVYHLSLTASSMHGTTVPLRGVLGWAIPSSTRTTTRNIFRRTVAGRVGGQTRPCFVPIGVDGRQACWERKPLLFMHPVSSTSLWNSRTRLYHSTSTSPVVTDPSLVSNNVKPHEDDQKNDHHHHHNGDDEKDPKTLQPGVSEGFFIIEEFPVPTDGLDISSLDDKMIDRLDLQPHNMSLPVALTLLAPHHYGSMSKARKACRKMNILIHRGPLGVDAETGKEGIFDLDKCVRGLVGHRVYAGDVIARQVRVGDGSYQQTHYEQPYDLPVVYQDDHFAIGTYCAVQHCGNEDESVLESCCTTVSRHLTCVSPLSACSFSSSGVRVHSSQQARRCGGLPQQEWNRWCHVGQVLSSLCD